MSKLAPYPKAGMLFSVGDQGGKVVSVDEERKMVLIKWGASDSVDGSGTSEWSIEEWRQNAEVPESTALL